MKNIEKIMSRNIPEIMEKYPASETDIILGK